MDQWMFAADHGQLGFRWLHVVAAVAWLGMLVFLRWVHAPFVARLDGATRARVVPELLPRALYWFRWGAAWTWFTGVCLLFLMYYVGGRGLYFQGGSLDGAYDPAPAQWGPSFAALFVAFAVYDRVALWLARGGALAQGAALCVGWLLALAFFVWLAGARHVSYRAGYVHVGALLGTTLAGNVWVRIWPAQRRMIPAIAAGAEPAPEDVRCAAQRAGHNGAMATALLFLMIGADQGRFGAARGVASSALALGGIFAVSWIAAGLCGWRARSLEGYAP